MSIKKNESINRAARESEGLDYGSTMAIGISLGMIFGMLLLDNIAMGMTGGMLLATISHTYAQMRQGRRHAALALLICLAGLVFLVAFWLV